MNNTGIAVSFNRWNKQKKMLGKNSFMGIPLTSKEKTGDWYVKFRHHNKNQYAALCQARVISKARLYERMGELEMDDFEEVIKGFQHLYFDPKNIPNSKLGWCGKFPKNIYDIIVSKIVHFVKKRLS